MSNHQNSASIHRHFHYHYHYDVSNQPNEHAENYSTRSSVSPKHGFMQKEMPSWRDKINPEVTRLCEEMDDSHSEKYMATPRTSIPYGTKRIEEPTIFVSAQERESNNLARSRMELIQNIEEYEEYLKKRSGSNLYIPNTSSLIKLGYHDYENPQKSMSQMRLPKENFVPRISLEDIVRKKADSKIFNPEKMYESTTAREEAQGYNSSQLKFSKGNGALGQRYTQRSEIKSPRNHFFVEKQNERLSQIFSNENLSSNERLENFNLQKNQFSSIQKSAIQEGFFQENKNQEPTSLRDILTEQKKTDLQNLTNNKNAENYHYELVKEECEFLRAKFIQHIQTLHGLKF